MQPPLARGGVLASGGGIWWQLHALGNVIRYAVSGYAVRHAVGDGALELSSSSSQANGWRLPTAG